MPMMITSGYDKIGRDAEVENVDRSGSLAGKMLIFALKTGHFPTGKSRMLLQ
jgi:hypothetical protein